MGRPRTQQPDTPDPGEPTAGPSAAAPTDRETQIYELGWKDGYQAAVDGQRPPLFEACKQAVLDVYRQPADALNALIDDVERRYEQQLRASDRDLIVGQALRLQRADRARAEGDRPAARRPKPRASRDADLPGPAATEYEHVS